MRCQLLKSPRLFLRACVRSLCRLWSFLMRTTAMRKSGSEETNVLLGETLPLYELPAAINCRDIAELDRKRIKPGIIFRSSEMFSLEAMADHGIKTLLDLRRQPDPETHPVYMTLEDANKSIDKGEDLRIYHYDMIQSSVKMTLLARMPRRIWGKLAKCILTGNSPQKMMCKAVADPNCLGFEKFYQILIDKSGNVIAEMMRVFTEPTNFPVLFHCMHGKDRAGILCCLLTMLAGVSPEVICQDYVESELQLKAAKNMYKLPIEDFMMEDEVISAPYNAINGLIRYIQEKHGGIEKYLISIGMTQSELSAIQTNIMQP